MSRQSFSRVERTLAIFAVVTIVVALFCNLGIYPLYLEEPRRALIALEMILRDNWIVPTQVGEFYYRKPPLYNWVIASAYLLFDNYSEFATRFFSILSYLAIGALMYAVGRKYVSKSFGLLSSLLFLVGADTFFSFTVVAGEIDLFYSLITFAGFVSLYHFYRQKQFVIMFLAVYGLHALGVLTKGAPSVVFLGISVVAFLIWKRDMRRLFTLAHFGGMAMFLLIVGGYFTAYAGYNDLAPYFDTIWSQSSARTLLEMPLGSLFGHLVVFPLEVVKALMPASLLILFVIQRDTARIIREKSFIAFCFLILVTNIAVYWISPGTRIRYVYMFFPLIVFILVRIYQSSGESYRLLRFLHVLVTIFTVMILIAVLAVPFLPALEVMSNRAVISAVLVIMLTGLLVVHLKKRPDPVLMLVLVTAVLRLGFSLTVLKVKSIQDSAAIKVAEVHEMLGIVRDEPLKMYGHFYEESNMVTVYYTTRERQEVLQLVRKYDSETFYLADPDHIAGIEHTAHYMFSRDDLVLVTFAE